MLMNDFDWGNVSDFFDRFPSDDESLILDTEGQFSGDRFTKEQHSSPVSALVYDVELTGSDTAIFPEGEISFTSREPKSQDPMPALARKMVEAGCDPDVIVRIIRNGKPVWKVDKPLRYWVELDIRELPDGKIVTRKYRPIPSAIGKEA